MTDEIVVYGAGGFGKEVACLINDLTAKGLEEWNFLGFIDDGLQKGAKNSLGEVLGGREFLEYYDKPLNVAIAIADPKTLLDVVNALENLPNLIYPNLLAPNTNFYHRDSFKLGKGNIVFYGCRFSCDVSIEDFNILNGQVAFGHDVSVGSFNSFGPSSRLSGYVSVGNQNFFGLGSAVLQHKKIGNNTRIGAGSIIMRNTKDENLYLGNPAKKMKGF